MKINKTLSNKCIKVVFFALSSPPSIRNVSMLQILSALK